MSDHPAIKQMRTDLAAYVAAHRDTTKTLMARQMAHEQLIESMFYILGSLLPPEGKTSLLENLYSLADSQKEAGAAAEAPVMDADDRSVAADLARRSSDALAEITDRLVACFRPA
ncbi:MAG TPA: hypothetical protein VFC54_08645 [Pseudolabrys sp.]|nr:hypothetical protein [Pseudolabrys sp.]